MTNPFTESVVEEVALARLEATDWQIAHGSDFTPGIPTADDVIQGAA